MIRLYFTDMPKTIYLRLPDALHRQLKARAAKAGISLSDYLIAEFKELAERPAFADLAERPHRRRAPRRPE